MNRLLARQIRRHLGGIENVPKHMMPLFEAIERSYNHYEEDRILIERSLEISSEELNESNTKILEEAAKNKKVLEKLRESLNTLLSLEAEELQIKPNQEDAEDVLKLIELIQIQSKRIKEVEEDILLVRNFINQSNDAITVTNEDGFIVFANENANNFLEGRDKSKEIFNLNIYNIDGHFQNKEYWVLLTSGLQENESITLEAIQYACNEKIAPIPVEIIIKAINVNHKKYFISVARDITVRIKAAARQRELINSLKIANEELENFAYIVSHDLKAPLRGIGSLTGWLTDDYAHLMDDDGKNHLKLLKVRVKRMHNLIEGILQYSRIGRVVGNKNNLNLNRLIEEIEEMLDTRQNLNLTILQLLPTIYNEETPIRQIFQNLISNAIKYNDKETCIVDIDFKDLDTHWQFSVKDNGPGIDKKYHQKIFKIFQTLTSKDTFESTGIGLTIIKKIIEYNKGKIWVESEMGIGCTFFFTLAKNIQK